MNRGTAMNEFVHSDLIQRALTEGLVRFHTAKPNEFQSVAFSGDNKFVISNSKERIFAQTYLSLLLDYHYPKKQIRLLASGTDAQLKQVDFIVYCDTEEDQPYIAVKCRKEDTSEMEFQIAVKQSFTYAKILGCTYLWVTSGIKNEYFIVNHDNDFRETIPDIPKWGSHDRLPYKYVKNGGSDENVAQFSGLKKVQENELLIRLQQVYQVLCGRAELSPTQAFDELNILVFCKLWDEKNCAVNRPYCFQKYNIDTTDHDTEQEKIKKQVREIINLSGRIKSLYEQGRKTALEVFKDAIHLSPQKINTVVSYLQDISLSESEWKCRVHAFEKWNASFLRENFAQFFTPLSIVQFMVNVLPIDSHSRILDTSCGSGGFLLLALDKVRGNLDKHEEIEAQESWVSFSQNQIYGIEADERISKVAKMNFMIHDAGYANIIVNDALNDIKELQKVNFGFEENSFDFVITNPPTRCMVKQAEKAYFANYEFGRKEIDWLDLHVNSTEQQELRLNQRMEVLLLEQAYRFLKPGGYLAIVLPEAIFSNPTLQYVRDDIEEIYRLVSVISLPQSAFSYADAGLNSSILILRKYSEQKTKIIRNAKEKLKSVLKEENKYEQECARMQAEKTKQIKTMQNFPNPFNKSEKEIKVTQEFKDWKKEIADFYNQLITAKKEEMEEAYIARKKNDIILNSIGDYEIYMAVADNIGYDTAGESTDDNDLQRISKELERFIAHVVEAEEV